MTGGDNSSTVISRRQEMLFSLTGETIERLIMLEL